MDSEEQDKKSAYDEYVIGKSETANVRESELFQSLKANKIADYHSYQHFISAHVATHRRKIAKHADPSSSTYQAIAAAADKGMTITYIILTVSTLIMAIISLAFPPIAILSLVTAALGVAWNYLDVLGGVIVGGESLYAGDKVSAFSNFFAALQLTAGTTLYVIGLPSLHLLSGALVTVGSAFASFGFAAFMGISCLLEVRAAIKGERRIQVLETLKNTLNPPEEGTEKAYDKIAALENYITVEKAAVQGHKVMAKMWLACFVGMTVISIIGVLTLSPIVAGVALAVVAVGTVATGAYRYHLQSKQANMEEGSSLKVPPFDDTPASSIEMTPMKASESEAKASSEHEHQQHAESQADKADTGDAHAAASPGQ